MTRPDDVVQSALAHEPLIRLAVFLAALTSMTVWELTAPRRTENPGRRRRWPGNVGLALVDTVVLRLVFPAAAVGFAIYVDARGWGLLPILDWPTWLAVPIAVLLLDFVVYLQHRVLHALPLLWRLHRVHHTDLEVDVTTALRFHPLEILFSMVVKLAAVAALGASPLAVLVFEALLNAAAMFNHSNIRMPVGVDRCLRCLIVTPDMHRVHHSIDRKETNSNFGFSFPWWDRWFGTYRAQPAAGHAEMTLGIESFRSDGDSRLDRLLIQPMHTPESSPLDRGPQS